MGRHIVKNWQYKSVRDKPLTQSPKDNFVKNELYLAMSRYKDKKKVVDTSVADGAVREILADLENQMTDWDLGCTALVLHRRYGYSAEEILEVLVEIQELTKRYIAGGFQASTVWDDVRDIIGLDIERDYS